MRKHWMYLLASSLLLAVFVTTGALAAGEGDPLIGGERNPSANQAQELRAETEIIAETDTYGTRQSNKSNNGGGAIYGCRAAPGGTPANNEPCLRANNLNRGLAFEFETDGNLTGTINSRAPGDQSKPFTTNATGVATGLNADRVDGLEAEQLVERATGRFAHVNAAGEVSNSRGVDSVVRDEAGRYRVDFTTDVTACTYSATLVGEEPGGSIVVSRVENEAEQLRVTTRGAAVTTPGGALAVADHGFHLTVRC